MIFPCQIIYSHAFTENIAQLACSGTQLHCSIWGQDLSAVKALICFAMVEPLNSQDLSSNSPYFYHAILVHVMLVWKIWYWINL